MRFVLSHHAELELKNRRIPPEILETVLHNPQQIVEEYGGKRVYQSQVDFGHGKIYLLRAIVCDNVEPAVVITVYKTSKIEKYWRSL